MQEAENTVPLERLSGCPSGACTSPAALPGGDFGQGLRRRRPCGRARKQSLRMCVCTALCILHIPSFGYKEYLHFCAGMP